jgi:hypothetical protein
VYLTMTSQTVNFFRSRFPETAAKIDGAVGQIKTKGAEAIATGEEFAGAVIADGRDATASAIRHGKAAWGEASALGQAVHADAKAGLETAEVVVPVIAARGVELGEQAVQTARGVGASIAGHAARILDAAAKKLED